MTPARAEKIPSSLKDWQQKLYRLELPADPIIKTAALQKLNARTGNASNVATILCGDPALCLLLMHEANKSLALYNNQVFSLSHTISLLGFPRTETLIRRAPEYDSNTFTHLNEYRQQLSVSLHAAHQAASWTKHNAHWPDHSLFWPALFHRAPLWALWYQAGDQMQSLQQLRCNRRGAMQSQAEQQLLGTSLQTLCTSLSRSWHLPSLSQQSWQAGVTGTAQQWINLSRMAPEQAHIALEQLPQLQQICSNPAFLIALVNRLAEESEWDWYSARTQRLHRIFATALSRPLDDVIALSHQQAVDASHQQWLDRCLTPARQLFSFYRKADDLQAKLLASNALSATALTSKALPNSGLNQQQKSTAVPVTPTRPTTSRKSVTSAQQPQVAPVGKTVKKAVNTAPSDFVSVTERLLQQPQSFGNLHEIMQLAVTTLCQGVKLERASVSLLNRKDKELRTYYSSGCENNEGLTNFRHHLQRGDLFNKLLQKPASLRLQAGNYSQLWPLLPATFKQASATDEFFMTSIFVNNHPVALIYGDCGIANSSLNDQQYSRFKVLCNAVSQCLQQQR